MGKITKSILEATSEKELQRIYDKYAAKCRQWNAAFMINCRTPYSIKNRIKEEDAKTFDLFTKFTEQAPVATAGTTAKSNHWYNDLHLARSKGNFTLENNSCRADLQGYYIDRYYPGFNVESAIDKNTAYEVCKTDILPDGIYHTMSYGFVSCSKGLIINAEKQGLTVSFKGVNVKKIYTAAELFESFKQEEEFFEKLANEFDGYAQDLSKYSRASETLIEFIEELFVKEGVSVEQKA